MTTAEFDLTTSRRTQFVSISATVKDIILHNEWHDGVLTIFVPHSTAGITINENADPDVARDMESFSNELVPQSRRFHHAEGNSDAHIKASFYGSSVQVIIRNRNLWLGTWQGIYFCEFDGPRTRNIYLAFSAA